MYSTCTQIAYTEEMKKNRAIALTLNLAFFVFALLKTLTFWGTYDWRFFASALSAFIFLVLTGLIIRANKNKMSA